ncbi:MAG TPA: RNA methyltransferase [Opitutaceae bacterium]|nr:RNA methyltransferase [Opitutaceae bacterium]
MKDNEIKICGLAAVRARFRRDASSIVRLYFDHPTSKKVGVMCRALAASRRVYRCVEASELERIADTVHHGGIVAVVEDRPPKSPTSADIASWARRHEDLVVLDRVGNAHNLGAIARSAAYFGVPRMVIAGDPASARPGAAAFRVAAGGLEAVEIWAVPEIARFLRALSAAGYDVVAAATRGGGDAAGGAKPAGPWALVLGNEEQGLAPEVQAACSRLATIPGSGRVESLNVSAAAAVLIRDLGRRGSWH